MGAACARSSALPCGMPSTTSTSTTSPSSFSTAYCATEAPTLPAPTMVIFGRAAIRDVLSWLAARGESVPTVENCSQQADFSMVEFAVHDLHHGLLGLGGVERHGTSSPAALAAASHREKLATSVETPHHALSYMGGARPTMGWRRAGRGHRNASRDREALAMPARL